MDSRVLEAAYENACLERDQLLLENVRLKQRVLALNAVIDNALNSLNARERSLERNDLPALRPSRRQREDGDKDYD